MKSDNLILFAVPTFVLTGMSISSAKRAAKVIAHGNGDITLDVNGADVKIPVPSSAERYATGSLLYFGDDGNVVGYEDTGKDVILKPAARDVQETSTSTRRSGSAERPAKTLR